MALCNVSIIIYVNDEQRYRDNMRLPCNITVSQLQTRLLAEYGGGRANYPRIDTFELDDHNGNLRDLKYEPAGTLITDLLEDDESVLIVNIVKGAVHKPTTERKSRGRTSRGRKTRRGRKASRKTRRH